MADAPAARLANSELYSCARGARLAASAAAPRAMRRHRAAAPGTSSYGGDDERGAGAAPARALAESWRRHGGGWCAADNVAVKLKPQAQESTKNNMYVARQLLGPIKCRRRRASSSSARGLGWLAAMPLEGEGEKPMPRGAAAPVAGLPFSMTRPW